MTSATTLHLDALTQLETLVSRLSAQVNTLSGDYTRLLEWLSHGAAPPVPAAPQSSLAHGDCIEVMRALPDRSADLILTDPPYLVCYKSRDGRTIQNDDRDSWLIPAFTQMHRVLQDNSFCISFYSWNKADRFMYAWKRAGFQPVGHFVFSKGYASSQNFTKAHHECAYLLAKGSPEKPAHPPRDVLGWKYTGNTLHPTQKPVEALEELIKAYSRPGGLVLDPFAGSASVAVAALAQGRRYLAIEKDPEYYAIAKKRLAEIQTPAAVNP